MSAVSVIPLEKPFDRRQREYLALCSKIHESVGDGDTHHEFQRLMSDCQGAELAWLKTPAKIQEEIILKLHHANDIMEDMCGYGPEILMVCAIIKFIHQGEWTRAIQLAKFILTDVDIEYAFLGVQFALLDMERLEAQE